MSYLLDTNTCIRYLNGTSKSVRLNLESRQPEDIILCSVVKAELFYGAMKSAKPRKNLQRIEKFFEPFISLPFDDRASKVYGKIRCDLEKSGTPIGPNDLLIAAIAVANEVILVTHNVKEFRRIRGMSLEDWEGKSS
ncbi:MAG: type II toxin-antitoxin system VapC family toxin [bacterium]